MATEQLKRCYNHKFRCLENSFSQNWWSITTRTDRFACNLQPKGFRNRSSRAVRVNRRFLTETLRINSERRLELRSDYGYYQEKKKKTLCDFSEIQHVEKHNKPSASNLKWKTWVFLKSFTAHVWIILISHQCLNLMNLVNAQWGVRFTLLIVWTLQDLSSWIFRLIRSICGSTDSTA